MYPAVAAASARPLRRLTSWEPVRLLSGRCHATSANQYFHAPVFGASVRWPIAVAQEARYPSAFSCVNGARGPALGPRRSFCAERRAHSKEELQDVLRTMDKETQEMLAGLVIHKHVIDAETDRVVAYLDDNDTHALGVAVMSRYMGKDFQKEFDRHDADDSGTICQQEFKRYLTSVIPEMVKAKAERPSNRQLICFFVNSAIPFVVFGALDNSIMIIGGDVVDDLIGSTFQLSTLGCAALANTFADVIGISIGNTVERFTARLGIPQANLTQQQAETALVRRLGLLAGSVGILVGCIIGMTPLLFLDQEKKALKEAFSRFDRDGSGSLEVDEIQAVLRTLGVEVSDKQVLEGIMKFDSAGKVSFDDFVHGYGKVK